ncbi:hypothetical protein GFO_1135 [Christiangramia forsetii KT0803]|uniref:Type II toxin-antitoxin system RelE/ParE family toxin n=1 Tax=Christiangramia forsetii (strain DSM 17595 / CGMCC 1.15422 / KT0803) TaxID=411154 RepID=A0M0G4_CHRFK|nr:hypothetical protein GFO_1135 [Christiangramia forsetii KT0803]
MCRKSIILETRKEDVKSDNSAFLIPQLAITANRCPKSSNFKDIYKCVVTEHTTFYYRIFSSKKEIEIITIFDTRQHPQKLKKDIE